MSFQEVIGALIAIIGVIWGAIGIFALFDAYTPGASDTIKGGAIITAFFIYIFPGLILLGIGTKLRSK